MQLIILCVVAATVTGCARLTAKPPTPDRAALQIADGLRRFNAELIRFKCIGKMALVGPDNAKQSFRAAMAGQLKNRLRIDFMAPFGGAAGSVSSDGRNLYLVMHP